MVCRRSRSIPRHAEDTKAEVKRDEVFINAFYDLKDGREKAKKSTTRMKARKAAREAEEKEVEEVDELDYVY